MPSDEVEAIAKQVFEYAGRLRTPGERFKVEARFFALLVALGRIEPASPAGDAPTTDSGQTYRTRDMTAEAPQKAKRNRRSIIGEARTSSRAH